jgi:tetratricopeptide (TPR) repeat protein
MTRAARVAALILVAGMVATALGSPASHAEPSAPPADAGGRDVDSEFNRGVRARLAKQWPAAVEAFQAAVTLRPAFPEAWNELGFALRNQGRYAESLAAYEEALRLRPDFPEALEYLGEAYVQTGRLDDARGVLERLRRLDAARADELDEAIKKAR